MNSIDVNSKINNFPWVVFPRGRRLIFCIYHLFILRAFWEKQGGANRETDGYLAVVHMDKILLKMIK
jgi:hypothetical protein